MWQPGWNWGHYAKENKPARERQIIQDSACKKNLKQTNKKKQRTEWWLIGLKRLTAIQEVQSFGHERWVY